MDSFKRVVTNMMARYGTMLTVIVCGDAVYDPGTSENIAAETEYEMPGVMFDFTLRANGAQAEPGTLIQAGDKHVFLQPTDGVPRLRAERDFVVLGDKRYKIVTYKDVNPSTADNMLIELLVRA